jgi:VCBS repeat protein
LRIGIRKQFVGVAVPALLFLAALAFPHHSVAAVHPKAFFRPSCSCGADFDRDGRTDRASISSRADAAFISLSLSGREKPIHLRAGKGVLDVSAFDIDSDGNVDLVALKTDLRIRVWLNNGRGGFVRQRHPASGGWHSRYKISGESQQSGSCCSSESDEDGAVVADFGFAVGPQHREVHGFRSVQQFVETPFLTSLRLRGPPVVLS